MRSERTDPMYSTPTRQKCATPDCLTYVTHGHCWHCRKDIEALRRLAAASSIPRRLTLRMRVKMRLRGLHDRVREFLWIPSMAFVIGGLMAFGAAWARPTFDWLQSLGAQ